MLANNIRVITPTAANGSAFLYVALIIRPKLIELALIQTGFFRETSAVFSG